MAAEREAAEHAAFAAALSFATREFPSAAAAGGAGDGDGSDDALLLLGDDALLGVDPLTLEALAAGDDADCSPLDLRLSDGSGDECAALLWLPSSPSLSLASAAGDQSPLLLLPSSPQPAEAPTETPQRRTRRRPQKAPTDATKPRKPLNYNPNKARDERREELLYLRKKVLELETQLDGLQQKRPRLTAHGSAGGGASPSEALTAGDALSLDQQAQQAQLVMASMWQDIATRQCEGRVKAERENIRLKIVLENQLKIAKSLEKLLKKKVAAREVEHCPQCQQLHHVYPPTTDPRTDAQIFDDLAAGVEQAYKDVDAVFAANGLAHMEAPHSDARIRSDSGHGMFLEILANKVLPFDVHSTATAAWHYFVHAKQRTPFRSYFFDSPKSGDTTDDTITENFSLGLHANSTSAHFRVKQIQRRFVEEDRVVIVWRSYVEPVEFSDEPLSDLRFRERGYIVLRRARSLPGDNTVVQTCYMFTPNFTGDVKKEGDHPKVGAITDFVLSATAANITASHQMIENVLIEQAARSGGGGGASDAHNDVTLPSGEVVENGAGFRNLFHLRLSLSVDFFVPCGGRPAADASTNKGGVTSSSLEVLAALSLAGDEFAQHMQVDEATNAVKEVQARIDLNDQREFKCI